MVMAAAAFVGRSPGMRACSNGHHIERRETTTATGKEREEKAKPKQATLNVCRQTLSSDRGEREREDNPICTRGEETRRRQQNAGLLHRQKPSSSSSSSSGILRSGRGMFLLSSLHRAMDEGPTYVCVVDVSINEL